MNAATAFGAGILAMLAGTAIAVFGGFVDPLPAAQQEAQWSQLNNLLITGFIGAAALLVWRSARRTWR